MNHNYTNTLELNDVINGYYVLQDARVGTAKTNKDYLNVNLMDRDGSIGGNQWDYAGTVTQEDIGTIVYVEGTVTSYKDQLQIKVETIRKAYDYEEGVSYTLDQLIPVAPIDPIEAMKRIDQAIVNMYDTDYQAICLGVLDEYRSIFRTIPAAKSIHHSFKYGLLMHTVNMVELATFVADLYGDFINRDLLIAGAIVHDIGKIHEFILSPYGLVTDYTTEGSLLGHLQIGAQKISEICTELRMPWDKVMLLEHMVLSHHGKPEYGSAVAPKCVESELLACIDMIDSRAEIYSENLAKISTGEFSRKVFSLGKRIYKH